MLKTIQTINLRTYKGPLYDGNYVWNWMSPYRGHLLNDIDTSYISFSVPELKYHPENHIVIAYYKRTISSINMNRVRLWK